MEKQINLFAFKFSINLFNKFSDDLLTTFNEALSNEITFKSKVKELEKIYGINLDMKQFNKIFNDEYPQYSGKNIYDLNSIIIFSVIASLVCELSLKYLTVINDKKFKLTHNLKSLFENLEISEQKIIKENTIRKCNYILESNFDYELNESAENFITLRYMYENNENETNNIFLKGFKDSLIELIETK